jgi:hypothetical protein
MSKFKVESKAKVEALRVEWEAAIKENKERNRALDALNRARSELTYAENVKMAAWAPYADAIGVGAAGPAKPSNRKRLELMFGPQDEG